MIGIIVAAVFFACIWFGCDLGDFVKLHTLRKTKEKNADMSRNRYIFIYDEKKDPNDKYLTADKRSFYSHLERYKELHRSLVDSEDSVDADELRKQADDELLHALCSAIRQEITEWHGDPPSDHGRSEFFISYKDGDFLPEDSYMFQLYADGFYLSKFMRRPQDSPFWHWGLGLDGLKNVGDDDICIPALIPSIWDFYVESYRTYSASKLGYDSDSLEKLVNHYAERYGVYD